MKNKDFSILRVIGWTIGIVVLFFFFAWVNQPAPIDRPRRSPEDQRHYEHMERLRQIEKSIKEREKRD